MDRAFGFGTDPPILRPLHKIFLTKQKSLNTPSQTAFALTCHSFSLSKHWSKTMNSPVPVFQEAPQSSPAMAVMTRKPKRVSFSIDAQPDAVASLSHLHFLFFLQKLNAFNFFFKHHRQLILDSLPENEDNRSKDTHGKVSFRDLATAISKRWKAATAEDKIPFQEMERLDKTRHEREMAEWKKQQELLARMKFSVAPVTRVKPPMQHRRQGGVAIASRFVVGCNMNSIEESLDPYNAGGTPSQYPFDSSMESLARQLGSDGVAIVVRAFL